MKFTREFFPRVRKTIMPRPYFAEEVDILGQSGIAWAADAAIHGDNWYLDRGQGLIESLDAPTSITQNTVKNFLIEKIQQDDEFAKRCLAILGQEQLMNKDLSQLFVESGMTL